MTDQIPPEANYLKEKKILRFASVILIGISFFGGSTPHQQADWNSTFYLVLLILFF